jgi:hypothetical protein
MNCSPPRASDMAKPATFPAVKARISNRRRLIIGAVARRSIPTNATSSATPPTSPAITHGFVQPIVCPP